MAVDPFTQQIFQFYNCSTIVEGEYATVPFSNNYTAVSEGSLAQCQEPDPQTFSAAFVGILDPPVNVSSRLDFFCSTGNCTFPSTEDGASFLSLALESRCADTSSDISVSFNAKNRTGEMETVATASLFDYGIRLDNTSESVMLSGFKGAKDWPASFLLTFSFLMQEAPGLARLQAFDCEFYPVVHTYNSNITNGVLLEQVLDSQRMDVWPTLFDTHALLLLNRTIRAGQWHQCTGSKQPSPEHILAVDNRPDIPGEDQSTSYPYFNKWWPQDCVYTIGCAPTQGLASSLAELLGNERLEDHGFSVPEGTPWAINLWRNGSATLETVQAVMDGISRTVSARWRQGDGTSNNIGPIVGTVWNSQACVRVNWGWIALPGGLLLGTLVFFILTVIKTRSRQAMVWKSSILAVLFSGLGQETRKAAAGPTKTLKEMKVIAGKATVRLEDTTEGFRLVSQT